MMLYGTKCWEVKNQQVHMLSVAEKSLLIQDKIGLGMDAFEQVMAAPLDEKMVNSHFKWFGHARRRSLEVSVRIVDLWRIAQVKGDLE